MAQNLNTAKIREWRSIITLIVFVLANIFVLYPLHIPIYIPRKLYHAVQDTLSTLRITPARHPPSPNAENEDRHDQKKPTVLIKLLLPLNFLTAPLLADLFLLAIRAIDREEVRAGTLGAANISPIDIMAFFVTLAYIALSIDASGLIRYLAFKVLQRGGRAGHRLYFYLYAFFFILGSFIGNDPIILSGTAFLAYMTRVSRNIVHPRAWIYAQFAVANIASAILVSSNPTNLVLAGAFGVRFVVYTANMIVPVVGTVVVLFPCLLYLIFRGQGLVPVCIEMHELGLEERGKRPVNPNIPFSRAAEGGDDDEKLLPLEEIMNPFLDKWSAAFGTVVMAAALITLLALNAASSEGNEHPVFWVTVPAAFVMLCWDLSCGWLKRHETREIARRGRLRLSTTDGIMGQGQLGLTGMEGHGSSLRESKHEIGNLVSLAKEAWAWLRETFPTVTTVLAHMPFPLVPFAFAMFVLVQALVTKGWIPVFAYGWDHWVNRTGTVGAVGGMGFISVILCNFAGTNIGTTILLSRVIQAWQEIHRINGIPISDRTFWATVYSMALGVNYGAFSTVFSASLAGLLWRDILERKHIRVRSLDFARLNLPIIAICMIVGCAVLIGEVYIMRGTEPYDL